MPNDPDSKAATEEACLLAQAGAGDRDAFRQLYDRYSRPLFSLAMRLVGNRAEAEELTQDSFVKIWRAAASFDASRSRPFSWAVTIVRRTCIDHLRRRSHHVPTVPFGPADEGGPPLGRPSDARAAVEAAEDSERIRGALGTLPAMQRGAVELALFSEFTHTEIAERLEQPVGTIKSWIRRGLIDLRTNLAEPKQ